MTQQESNPWPTNFSGPFTKWATNPSFVLSLVLTKKIKHAEESLKNHNPLKIAKYWKEERYLTICHPIYKSCCNISYTFWYGWHKVAYIFEYYNLHWTLIRYCKSLSYIYKNNMVYILNLRYPISFLIW